jgi:hypothetical protein
MDMKGESGFEGVVPSWCWCRPVGCFLEGLQHGHGHAAPIGPRGRNYGQIQRCQGVMKHKIYHSAPSLRVLPLRVS